MRASTSENRGYRRALPAVVAGALLLAGCFAALRSDTEKRFDHSHHAKKGLDCTDCHGEGATSAKFAMPAPATCRDCHEGKDPLDVAAAVSAYAALPAESRHVRPPTFADTRFDHAKHAAAKVSCTDCHTGAKTEVAANPSGPLHMADCLKCHEERNAGPKANDCRACHEVWARDTKPQTHRGQWITGHGPSARSAKDNVTIANVERCDLCHSRSSCDECHQKNPPRDHTQSWRTATHGLSAAVDRSRCQACHTADSCVRCHQTQPPRSHGGAFGAPRDTHCLTCHDPVGDSSCSVCHKGTPSHSLAAPKPPGHISSMNCRQCHGAGQPLPHVDNGTECNTCHH